MAALSAKSQMHPGVAHLEALFAAVGFRLYVLDLIGVRTNFSHCASSVLESGFDGDADFESRITGNRLHGDQAFDLSNDAVSDVEAEPCALANALRREKRFENFRLNLGRDTGAIVGN